MRRFNSLILVCALLLSGNIWAQHSPKREFRGAWIQTVFQGQYAGMNQQQMQKYMSDMLDKLQEAGMNAVIFQMRPSADAFYPSDLEPWSRFLTGKAGKAPSPVWDPAEYLISECHKRNMEFHAWLNPYRVTVSANEQLPANHIYFKHPEWFVTYGGKIYFDPGLPQCRKFFREVVSDIVSRYDLDAIHMDDYFYPYPVSGEEFPDQNSFETYRKKMNFEANEIKDWRRQNVNILIKSVHEDIRSLKPWVRFGISPFGIYRNQKSDPDGSKTNGLQNYDDLYADVLLWTREGWIDYLIPQLYWESGHKAADYDTLIEWWNRHANDTHLYIGQSISRSLDEDRDLNTSFRHFNKKIGLSRKLENINGNCFWYGYQIMNNEKKIGDILSKRTHATPAMIPAYSVMDEDGPKGVRRLKTRWTENGYELQWKRRDTKNEMQKQVYYSIYRFPKGTKKDIHAGNYLVGTTRETYFLLPYDSGEESYEYVVTAVDRMHNESKKTASKKIKL